MTLETDLKEMKERMRRMETRLTAFLEVQGYDTGAKQPKWDHMGKVHIPSVDVSLKKIMRVIPEDWDRGVQIVHQDKNIAILLFGNARG